MSLIAVTKDGTEYLLDPKYGDTPEDITSYLTREGLTGSGAPVEFKLDTRSGFMIAYSDVNTFRTIVE